jgi:hypothetical protein
MSITVKLSAYERALNLLNKLPEPDYLIVCAALDDLRKQRDEARAEVERLMRAHAQPYATIGTDATVTMRALLLECHGVVVDVMKLEGISVTANWDALADLAARLAEGLKMARTA